MNIRWRVELSQDEREELTALLKSGRHAVRKVKRAQILLAADDGVGDGEVAARVGAGGSTVYRTKRRFVEGNLELALVEAPRPGAQRKLSGKEEALLIATACSAPPAGRARWTLELLADVMVALTEHEGLSRETVRRRLAENALKPWRRDMWCVPKVDAAYVAAMEDVLDLYGEPPDPTRPVICFDESPTQLIGEVRAPIPAEPGRLERFDFEYKRNGTVNLFIFLDVNRPWRKVKVTERRAAADFSQCMRELSDVHFPEAEKIRVVMDNLSTHSPASLYNALPAPEARRILRRLEFHFTPKHASWLNMVEIEIGVLRGQCLDRRISSRDILEAEIAAWERQRNDSAARIKWMFTTEKARHKLSRAYAIRPPKNQSLQESIAHLLTRPVGRPPNRVQRYYASFSYQAGSWDRKRRVVAKMEWHPGELVPRVGLDRFHRSSVTNLSRPADRVVAFYNQRGKAEQYIKEGKNAIKWTRLSCRKFRDNKVRLQLHALAYNLANFMRTLALPKEVEHWSLTTLREKLVKIGAKVVRHGRYVTFQLAEVAVPRSLFQKILGLIDDLRRRPVPA